MKISHKETRPTEVEVVDDVLCNSCGNSCRTSESRFNDRPDLGGLVEAEVHGGYDSVVGLIDLMRYRFSICELCLVDMFDRFKIPPDIYCATHAEAWTLERHREYRRRRAESGS